MKKVGRLLLLLFAIFFCNLEITLAEDPETYECYLKFKVSDVKEKTMSIKSIISQCYDHPFVAGANGTWKVIYSNSKHMFVNTKTKSVKFSKLNDLEKSEKQYEWYGEIVRIGYESTTNNYDYRLHLTFLEDSQINGNGKCCRNLTNNGTNYYWDLTGNSSCNTVSDATSQDACLMKNGTDSAEEIEDKEVCILTGKKYHWGKLSSITSGSKEVPNLSKEDCNTKMKEQATIDNIEGNAKVEEANKNIESTTTDSSITDTGESACKDYKIIRVRTYNPKSSNANTSILNTTSDYFKSPVTKNSDLSYYNVYKAYCADNGGQENVSSFCIDPGLTGPTETPVNYIVSKTISPNTPFGKGVYRLYSHWYKNETGRAEILKGFNPSIGQVKKNGKNQGSISEDTVKNDYIDYIVNNVARLLVYNYGKNDNPSISFECDTSGNKNRCSKNGWAGKEIGYYSVNDFPDSSATTEYSRDILRRIWNDVKQYIADDKNDSQAESSNVVASSNWIIPIKKFTKLVGDFRSGSSMGRYCNYVKGDGKYSAEAFARNEAENIHKHNGIDFTINPSEVGKVAVYAAQTGIVKYAGNHGNMGNAVVIIVKTADGKELRTRYLHLDSIDKSIKSKAAAKNEADKIVQKGEFLGYVGNTGDSSGPHLHFDISSNDVKEDKWETGSTLYSPRDYLPMSNIEICKQSNWQQNTPDIEASSDASSEEKVRSIKFELEEVSSGLTNNNQGFEAQFKIHLSSVGDTNDIEALNYITDANNPHWSISATTDTGESLNVDKIEQLTGFQTDGTTRDAEFKVTSNNALVGVSSKAKKIKLKFNIEYRSPYSISNILLLTSTGGGNENGKYQRFLTFLNGNIELSKTLPIDIANVEKDQCNPLFSLTCMPINTVSYLIEGTQSPEIFNQVMNGIDSVDRLTSVVQNSTALLEKLKNFDLNVNDILYIGSLAYNITDDLKHLNSIRSQLTNLLSSSEFDNNTTAKNLKAALLSDKIINKNETSEEVKYKCGFIFKIWNCKKTVNNVEISESDPDYTKDESQAFIDFIGNINSLLTDDKINYQTLKNELNQIYEATKTNGTIVDNYTKGFVETIFNLVKEVKNKDTLKHVLNGLTEFGKSVTDGTILEKKPSLDSIRNLAQNMSSAIQGTLQTATSSVGNIIDQLKSISLKIPNASVNDLSDIMNLFTKATTTDWEHCIIGNTDPDGNAYEVQGQNMYCSISCKEDYAFKMPGNLGTAYVGQNLTTNLDNIYQATVGIAGQRTCVTTAIDNDAYVRDAFDKKQEIVEKYNEIMKTYNQQNELLNNNNGEIVAAHQTGIGNFGQTEIENLKNAIEKKLGVIFQDSVKEFVNNLVAPDVSPEEKNRISSQLINEAADVIKGIGGSILSQIMSGEKNISQLFTKEEMTTLLTEAFKSKIDEYKENFKPALEKAVNYFISHIGEVASDSVLALAGDAAKLGVAFGLATACHSAKLLNGFPVVGNILAAAIEGVCEVYASVTTAVVPALSAASQWSGGLFLGYYKPAKTSYDFQYGVYSYGNLPAEGLLSCKKEYEFKNDDNYYTNVLNGDIVCVGTDSGKGTLKGNEIFIPVLEPGSYNPSFFSFGIFIDFVKFGQGIAKIQELSAKIPELLTDISGFTSGSLTDLIGTLANPNLSALNQIKNYATTKDANGKTKLNVDTDNMQKLFPAIFNYISANASYASSALTELIDISMNAVYNLLGGLNPYFASLADVNNTLLDQKQEYNDLRTDLSKLAQNMHDCTVWENSFSFDPKVTFTYGYRYFGAVKSSTTETVNLEMINKQEQPEEVYYYCDSDVKINDIQSLNTIFKGKCTTSDGIIGGILSALLGDNETFGAISSFIHDNSGVIRSFMKNDKVKQYLGNYYNTICVFGGEDLCVSSKDDELITGIPGDIVYQMTENASLKDTIARIQNSFTQNSKDLINSVISGKIISDFISAISTNFRYGPSRKDEMSYRNVGRVVRISRYGNPGVSISGIDTLRFAENMVTYVANYLNVPKNTIVTKIYDAITSINGGGSQKFVYFRSSKPYFTYSNKGIYTSSTNSSDKIPVDYGDKALFDDKISSGIKNADGTEAAKTPTGKVYPIALSTTPGTYFYRLTINNIGQYYNNNFALGRIVDDNGYINGIMENKYVCSYKVETATNNCDPSDPECSDNCDPNDPECSDNNPICSDLIEQAKDVCKTKNGEYFKDLYHSAAKDYYNTDNKANWTNCINKLLENNNTTCCDYISSDIPDTAEEIYNQVCSGSSCPPGDSSCSSKPDGNCKGFHLLACVNSNEEVCKKLNQNTTSKDYNVTESGQTALIKNNGGLEFYTKVVSNYNLFPNGIDAKGDNWKDTTSGNEARDENNKPVKQKISSIISDIESKGDSIYDDDPEYYIELNSACMSKIKEYNNHQEINDLGFGDYTGGIENLATRKYRSEFLKDLETNSEYQDCAKMIQNNLD